MLFLFASVRRRRGGKGTLRTFKASVSPCTSEFVISQSVRRLSRSGTRCGFRAWLRAPLQATVRKMRQSRVPGRKKLTKWYFTWKVNTKSTNCRRLFRAWETQPWIINILVRQGSLITLIFIGLEIRTISMFQRGSAGLLPTEANCSGSQREISKRATLMNGRQPGAGSVPGRRIRVTFGMPEDATRPEESIPERRDTRCKIGNG